MERKTYSISRRCSEVTIDEFIDCACSANYKRLVRGKGEPANTELEEAFQELYAEYNTLTGNGRYSYTVSLMRKKVRLEARLGAAAIALQINDTQLLSKLGYKGNVELAVNSDMLELEVVRRELAVAQSGKEKKVERKDFLLWVGAVSKVMGFKISIRDTMLDEFLTWSDMAKKATKAKSR